jgi:hypothetical protein
MWCWRRIEKISWIDHVRNVEVLHRVKEERNVLHKVKIRKANSIGDIFLRNCLLKHVIEGKIEGRIVVKERRGRSCKQLLGDLKKTRGNWKLERELLDLTLWRTCCGRVTSRQTD